MPFIIISTDITKLYVDAIINAANTGLQQGGGVCGAIFEAAGAEQLQAACDSLAPINTGEAVITQAYNLPSKYIIHTAGPIYHDGKHGEEALLRSCYTNSLELAVKYNCERVAFPLISSGIYGYPKAEALRVATKAILDFISEHDIEVSLVVFDRSAFAASEELLGAVDSYIGENYIERDKARRRKLLDTEIEAIDALYSLDMNEQSMPKSRKIRGLAAEKITIPLGAKLEDIVGKLDEPFSAMLLRLVDSSGKKDAEIYRSANIDRRLFSKIRSNEHYVPSKPTVLAFAIALELDLEQTADLLARAGFTLTHTRKFDVIIEYFIRNRNFDIFEINEMLFRYDQPLLGGSSG